MLVCTQRNECASERISLHWNDVSSNAHVSGKLKKKSDGVSFFARNASYAKS